MRSGAGVPGRGWVAPRLLDPVLALAEVVDRLVRRITPIQPGALLATERHRYRGEPMVLRDGTRLQRGDRVDILHFENRRLRELAGAGWQRAALGQARQDLAALARRLRAVAPADRPLAYHGSTVLAPFGQRLGWEVRPRSRTPWHRFEDWYLRSILVRWAPGGRERMQQGHTRLGVEEVWISVRELLETDPQ